MSADAPNPGAVRVVSRSGGSGAEKVAPGARFPRSARLLKHSDFDRVYKQGRRHFSSQITVFYLKRDEGPARVGFTVGRVLGGAVDRNRIKRRLREAVRLRRSLLTVPVDVVVNPKKSALRVEFSMLLEEITRAFEVISRNVDAGAEQSK